MVKERYLNVHSAMLPAINAEIDRQYNFKSALEDPSQGSLGLAHQSSSVASGYIPSSVAGRALNLGGQQGDMAILNAEMHIPSSQSNKGLEGGATAGTAPNTSDGSETKSRSSPPEAAKKPLDASIMNPDPSKRFEREEDVIMHGVLYGLFPRIFRDFRVFEMVTMRTAQDAKSGSVTAGHTSLSLNS